jgi:hypothetical protein
MIDSWERGRTGAIGQKFIHVGGTYCLKAFDNRIESGS